MPLHLQPSIPADLPGVVKLMNTAYRGAGAQAGWTNEASYIEGDRTTEALLQADMAAAPGGRLLVARDDQSSLLACVWLERYAADTWYVGSLTVDPSRQNAGLGRELLAAAEQWAITRGARAMRMTVVNVRSGLLDWYERRGYHRTGETQPFPYGDNRFGTPLRDDLSFVVLEKCLAPPPDSRH